jgi:transcriptional regulator with XRE-family HTH domain
VSSRPSDMFQDRLRQAREKRGLNQGDLAKRAGLQASAVSHFETGGRKPSFDNLRRLADALECTTDFLLGRVDELSAVAGADQLNRHAEKLRTEDLAIAEEFMKILAKRSREKNKK